MSTRNGLFIIFAFECLVLSVGYILVNLFDSSIQMIFNAGMASGADVTSFVFLSHGLSVLTAWLYGLKSIPLLLIPAAWAHSLSTGSNGFWSISGHDPLISLVIVPLVFVVARSIGLRVASSVTGFDWRHIMGCGFAAAFFCATISSLINGTTGAAFAVLAASAVIGQIVFFALLLIGYRALRWFRQMAHRTYTAQG